MGKIGQSANLRGLVDRPNLSGLRNRNDPWLNVVLVANTVIGGANGVPCEFAARGRNGNQFAAGKLFRCAALVHINVGTLCTDHRVIRIGERLKAEAVSGRTVKYEENLHILPKMPPEMAHRCGRIGIIAITDDVPLVDSDESLQDIGVNPGVIVTGKVAGSLHGSTI